MGLSIGAKLVYGIYLGDDYPFSLDRYSDERVDRLYDYGGVVEGFHEVCKYKKVEVPPGIILVESGLSGAGDNDYVLALTEPSYCQRGYGISAISLEEPSEERKQGLLEFAKQLGYNASAGWNLAVWMSI